MATTENEPINAALRDHQTTAGDWTFHQLAANLHTWAERMITDFKIDIGTPALMVERLRRGRLGHYRHGRNAFGLRDEIGIDEDHARHSEYWRVLGTLLHELLHSWQEHHGRPGRRNYHSKEYRERARSLGLMVDRRGVTEYAPGDTPFLALLREYGVEVPTIPEPEPLPVREGRSTLVLYKCPCGVNVRVGRSRFNARCLDCDGLFKRMT